MPLPQEDHSHTHTHKIHTHTHSQTLASVFRANVFCFFLTFFFSRTSPQRQAKLTGSPLLQEFSVTTLCSQKSPTTVKCQGFMNAKK